MKGQQSAAVMETSDHCHANFAVLTTISPPPSFCHLAPSSVFGRLSKKKCAARFGLKQKWRSNWDSGVQAKE